MLVILKRGGILFLALLVIVSFLIYTLRAPDAESVAWTGETIVIDAGHGDPDGGAVGGQTGVLEKDLNLTIAKKLSEKLRNEGETVLMTREDDRGLYTDENTTVREKKRADMKKRVTIANAAGNLCFVSIHMNHFTDPQYSGPQIFYAAGSADGMRLAEEIRLAILDTIGPHCTREIKPTSDLYLLRETDIPAVIVECGFLSNVTEEALLADEAYQDSMATAICQGIKNFKNAA